jgi:hypothetical protein
MVTHNDEVLQNKRSNRMSKAAVAAERTRCLGARLSLGGSLAPEEPHWLLSARRGYSSGRQPTNPIRIRLLGLASDKFNNLRCMRTWLEYRLSTGVYNLARLIISKKPVVAIPNGYAYPLILLVNLDCPTLDQFAPNREGLRV